VSCGCSGLFSCGVCSVSVQLTDICKWSQETFFFPFHLTNPSHTMLHIHFASQSCPKPVSCSISCASCPHFTGFLHQKERDELLEGLMGTSLTRNQKGIFQKYGLLERLINWDVCSCNLYTHGKWLRWGKLNMKLFAQKIASTRSCLQIGRWCCTRQFWETVMCVWGDAVNWQGSVCLLLLCLLISTSIMHFVLNS